VGGVTLAAEPGIVKAGKGPGTKYTEVVPVGGDKQGVELRVAVVWEW
jgi:hypothetical protein